MSLSDIFRGDTKRYALTFKDSAGVAIPLYGKKLYFTLKSDMDQADVDAALQVVVTFPNDAESLAGRHLLVIPATDTEAVEPGTYFYDFQLVEMVADPAPDIVTTLTPPGSKVKVLPDVTRTTA